jgi:hypothetical protein
MSKESGEIPHSFQPGPPASHTSLFLSNELETMLEPGFEENATCHVQPDIQDSTRIKTVGMLFIGWLCPFLL